MTKNIYLLAGTLLSALLAGCVASGPGRGRGYAEYQTGQPRMAQVDYDYYPGYETYYNRTSHEYVYRDGNAWVSRPEPRGISASVLLATPSVRMAFHDAPAQHHASVTKTYPKNWKSPAKAPDRKDPRANGRKDDGHQN